MNVKVIAELLMLFGLVIIVLATFLLSKILGFFVLGAAMIFVGYILMKATVMKGGD